MDIVKFRHTVDFAIFSAMIGPEDFYGLLDWLRMAQLENLTRWRNLIVSRMHELLSETVGGSGKKKKKLNI